MDSQSDQPCEPEARRSADELKPAISDAIGAHLREQGPKGWDLLRERAEYAHVIGAIAGKTGERRFYRWVAKVREDMPPDHTKPHDGRDANQAHQAWSTEEAPRATEKLGVPTSASFFMKRGADGLQTLSMYDAAQDAWNDLIRAIAVIDQAPMKPRAKAAALAGNAQVRLKAMAEIARLHRQLSDIDALHARYKLIIQFLIEDCAPYPELQAKLLSRVRDCNSAPIPVTPQTP